MNDRAAALHDGVPPNTLDFLGIGAQKAGTSWIHKQLSKHPEIVFPGGKEIHFWDMHYEKGIGWYERRLASAPGSVGVRRVGEITPAYATLSQDRIAVVHTHYPCIRLFYVLRNPIDRAWSSALMALSRAEMQVHEASDAWFIDHFRSRGSLLRGDYEQSMRNWSAFYPKDAIQVLLFDDLIAEPRRFLRVLAAHLHIDTSFFDGVSDAELAERVLSGGGMPIRPSLRSVLEEMYAAKIQSLGSFLGVRLDWA